MSRTRIPRMVCCVCCGTEGPLSGRGLINVCYLRHWKAGTLDRFAKAAPDPEKGREWARNGREAYSRMRANRVEDYAELRSWGEIRETAAARLDVTSRTVQRYERTLREQASV